VQYTLVAPFGEDSEVELELGLRAGAQFVAIGDAPAVVGVNLTKKRGADCPADRRVASKQLIHLR